ncbi:HEPN domain-containing protein [Photobacterium sp. J15]|uniref:HEPN domain-containing protein n=1 Tax=Photobacterium sp. J15 TaxID=265901 RepID=UPI0007E41B2E|nr:HEPN domain-containing protein [Photobacterium sp. J15]
MSLKHAGLKTRHRKERSGYPKSLSMRVHRALSWLEKSELCEDLDSQYIFLWIAFNAAYANDLDLVNRPSERELFRHFLARLEKIDTKSRLYNLVWQSYSNTIRVLLDNPYIFEPFWDYQRGNITKRAWQEKQNKVSDKANRALANKDTVSLLSIILCRCYTLRNQLVHGGATWQSDINREQVRDCTRMLADLVPLIIDLMMDGKDLGWGDSVYPNLKAS